MWCWEKTSCVVTLTNYEKVNSFWTQNSVLVGNNASSLVIRIPKCRNNVAPSSSGLEMSFFSVTSTSKRRTMHCITNPMSDCPSIQRIAQLHCCENLPAACRLLARSGCGTLCKTEVTWRWPVSRNCQQMSDTTVEWYFLIFCWPCNLKYTCTKTNIIH
jgi:hypothetical protein